MPRNAFISYAQKSALLAAEEFSLADSEVLFFADFIGEGCHIARDYCKDPTVCGERGECSVPSPDQFKCDCIEGEVCLKFL